MVKMADRKVLSVSLNKEEWQQFRCLMGMYRCELREIPFAENATDSQIVKAILGDVLARSCEGNFDFDLTQMLGKPVA